LRRRNFRQEHERLVAHRLDGGPGNDDLPLTAAAGEHHVAFPGLAIYLTVLGFNLAGDGLRDTTARSAARAPEPPQMIVTDLQGRRAHAAAFGALEGQTLEEAWTLVVPVGARGNSSALRKTSVTGPCSLASRSPQKVTIAPA
jgi:hypothetical protein